MDNEAKPDIRETPRRAGPLRVVVRVVLVVAGLLLLAALILPHSFGPRLEAHHRSNCTNILKQIGIALYNYHDYHDTSKCFPPAFVLDDNGIPMHSWRVLLLPYFEDPDLHALYRQYRFDEPWDGPNNSKLADAIPAVYRCPSDESCTSDTNYVAVVGADTMWPGTKCISVRDISDGSSRTIALVEVAESGINWLEPRDLTLTQASRGINPDGVRAAIHSKHSSGANFLFCDGSVHFLQNTIPLDVLRGLLTANGGEDLEIENE